MSSDIDLLVASSALVDRSLEIAREQWLKIEDDLERTRSAPLPEEAVAIADATLARLPTGDDLCR